MFLPQAYAADPYRQHPAGRMLFPQGGNYVDYQEPEVYGAAPAGAKKAFVHGVRRRLNLVAICLSLFTPWILFTVVSGTLSSSIHYETPPLCYAIFFVAFLMVCAFGIVAADACYKKNHGHIHREPTWLVFLFITSAFALIAALVFGDINFWMNTNPYYDLAALNTYTSIDTTQWRGQQLMDAGRVLFTKGTKLDLQRAAGFKSVDTFCVAPITTSEGVQENYDFWAVGKNCCSGVVSNFHCGEFNNPHANGGLRLMGDNDRPFFRLAVQEAEAAYNIKATHPLFFHWMHDPISSMEVYRDDSIKYFLIGMFSFFVFQMFLVAAASVLFSKLGYF